MLIEFFKKVDEARLKHRVRTLMRKRIRGFNLSKYEFAEIFGIEPEEVDNVLISGFNDKCKNLIMGFILSNSRRFIDFVNSRVKYET